MVLAGLLGLLGVLGVAWGDCPAWGDWEESECLWPGSDAHIPKSCLAVSEAPVPAFLAKLDEARGRLPVDQLRSELELRGSPDVCGHCARRVRCRARRDRTFIPRHDCPLKEVKVLPDACPGQDACRLTMTPQGDCSPPTFATTRPIESAQPLAPAPPPPSAAGLAAVRRSLQMVAQLQALQAIVLETQRRRLMAYSAMLFGQQPGWMRPTGPWRHSSPFYRMQPNPRMAAPYSPFPAQRQMPQQNLFASYPIPPTLQRNFQPMGSYGYQRQTPMYNRMMMSPQSQMYYVPSGSDMPRMGRPQPPPQRPMYQMQYQFAQPQYEYRIEYEYPEAPRPQPPQQMKFVYLYHPQTPPTLASNPSSSFFKSSVIQQKFLGGLSPPAPPPRQTAFPPAPSRRFKRSLTAQQLAPHISAGNFMAPQQAPVPTRQTVMLMLMRPQSLFSPSPPTQNTPGQMFGSIAGLSKMSLGPAYINELMQQKSKEKISDVAPAANVSQGPWQEWNCIRSSDACLCCCGFMLPSADGKCHKAGELTLPTELSTPPRTPMEEYQQELEKEKFWESQGNLLQSRPPQPELFPQPSFNALEDDDFSSPPEEMFVPRKLEKAVEPLKDDALPWAAGETGDGHPDSLLPSLSRILKF